MEAFTNFHGSNSTCTNFRGISMEVNLLPPTSREVSMEVGGNVHGSGSKGRRWSLYLWKSCVEGARSLWYSWKWVWVFRGIWKLIELPRNIFVYAAIDGSSGSFHFHRQLKLPYTSMEASTNFHGGKSTSISFHGNFHGTKFTSTEFHGSFHGSILTSIEVYLLLWKQIELESVDPYVSLAEGAWSLWTRGSRWKYGGV